MKVRFLLIAALLVVSVCACEQTSQESSERSQPVPSQTQFRFVVKARRAVPRCHRVKKPPSTSGIVPEQKWTATGMESLVNLSGVVTRPDLRFKPASRYSLGAVNSNGGRTV